MCIGCKVRGGPIVNILSGIRPPEGFYLSSHHQNRDITWVIVISVPMVRVRGLCKYSICLRYLMWKVNSRVRLLVEFQQVSARITYVTQKSIIKYYPATGLIEDASGASLRLINDCHRTQLGYCL